MKRSFKETMQQNKADFIKFIVFFIVIVGIVILSIELLPWIISLKDESGREALQNYIYSKGAWGVLILAGIQVAQVVVAFIPGEPIEVVAGLLYGTWGGYAICTVGMLAGTILIYYMVKLLGASFIHRLVGGEEKISKFRFLQDTKKLEALTFLFFFIPGTPKDFLTYFMPLTKIKPVTFFVIVTVARIPSIISSTFAGASIGEGKWLQTVIIFAVIGTIALLGIIFNNYILKRISEGREKLKNRFRK